MHCVGATAWQVPSAGDAHVPALSLVQTPTPPTLMAAVPVHSPTPGVPLATWAHTRQAVQSHERHVREAVQAGCRGAAA